MYTTIEPNKISEHVADNFRLCYVERVEKKEYDEHGNEYSLFDDENEHIDMYFTNCDMDLQWGDDWNDAPYEHNADIPYDDHYEDNERVEHKIIKISFSLKRSNGDGCAYYYQLPKDYGYNSPFSVEMINAGIVAWLSISSDKMETIPGSKFVVIHGGDSIKSVVGKLEYFQ